MSVFYDDIIISINKRGRVNKGRFMEILRFKAISVVQVIYFILLGIVPFFGLAFTDITVVAWIAAVVSIVQAVFQKNSVRESVSVIGGGVCLAICLALAGMCLYVTCVQVGVHSGSLYILFDLFEFAFTAALMCGSVALYIRAALACNEG